MNDISSIEQTSDAALVAACLAGKRSAYGEIVERYQRLLCSLAYSAMGSLSDSEDMAQEAFVEGWKKLATLREPEKLRAWLCGILRFKVSHRRRSDAREPVRVGHTMESMSELESEAEAVEEAAMKDEEQALLWQALEQVPELYREPLVLYYREHRSVEHVACELDLTESTVKQRLSRGRKMLKERMLEFVEGALARSTPGSVFTMGVLAALPVLAPPAKAVGVGVAAAHTGTVVKSVGVVAALAMVSGLVSSVIALRSNLDQARTPLERREVVKTTIKFLGIFAGFIAALFALRAAALEWPSEQVNFAFASQALVFAFIILFPVATYRILKRTRVLRSSERLRHPDLFSDSRDAVGSAKGEYRSRAKLFGVPLVHIKFAMPDDGDPPVFGWIAMGDRAYGLLFAWGGFAVAPVSVGIVSVGLVTVGGVGLGVFGIGSVAIGLLAYGGVALGINAFGGLSALGWDTAAGGGFAIAREAALGPIAFAAQVNDKVAQELVMHPQFEQFQVYVMVAISFFVIVPVTFHARAARKRMRS